MTSGFSTRRSVSPGCPFCPPVFLPDRSRRLVVRGGFFNPSLEVRAHVRSTLENRLLQGACRPRVHVLRRKRRLSLGRFANCLLKIATRRVAAIEDAGFVE